MLKYYHDESNEWEISVDEVARGVLFGRCYVASCIFPRNIENEEHRKYAEKNIKDSKKIHSRKKMTEVANFIKKVALAYHITYIEADEIDRINILQSVFKGMHQCICEIIPREKSDKGCLLIDGDKFKPFFFTREDGTMTEIPHHTIVSGDAKYMGIAAASILAKDAHDRYIDDLSEEYPELITRYALNTNVGYATSKHLEGIRTHGISQFHRRTFGDDCRNATLNPVQKNENTNLYH